MGKKDRQGLKRQREEDLDSEDEEMDPELQAELKALMSMHAEQEGAGQADDSHTQPVGRANNKDGMLRALESSGLAQLPFKETMQICQFDVEIEDENDDLARELAFYNHSLVAVEHGLAKLQAAGVPTLRPSDYFCEQMKSDAHMTKIKDNLILEEKKMEAFEQRKNREMNKKFNKQLQAQKKDDKKHKEKEEISSFKKFRMGKGEDSERLEEALSQSVEKSSKRKAMDKKYGHGGKSRLARKMVDKKSLNDLSQYDPKGGKIVRQAMEGRRGGRGGGRGAGRGGSGGRGGGRGGDSRQGGRGGGGGGSGGAKRASSNRPGKDARAAKRSNRSA